MIQSLLTSMLIIAIAMTLLSVKVIVKKKGKFTSQHIHDSKAMKERNILCVLSQDKEARQKNRAY